MLNLRKSIEFKSENEENEPNVTFHKMVVADRIEDSKLLKD
jgi:hypothetical protein